MVPLTSPSVVLLFGCFVKGPFNTQRGVKNLIGQFGVLHPLHPQCGCSSVKMCEQRTWTVCCFLLGPKPVTLESIPMGAEMTFVWTNPLARKCARRQTAPLDQENCQGGGGPRAPGVGVGAVGGPLFVCRLPASFVVCVCVFFSSSHCLFLLFLGGGICLTEESHN